MAISQMTELDAVNIGLRFMGQSPVDSITGIDPDSDAAGLRDSIRTHVRMLCERGDTFNAVVKELWVQDVNGRVPVPTYVAAVQRVYPEALVGGGALIVQGGYVYDRLRNTTILNQNVYADFLRLFDFEELPTEARTYCAYSGSAEYLEGNDGDDRAIKRANYQASDSWDAYLAADDRMGGYGVHNDLEATKILYRNSLSL